MWWEYIIIFFALTLSIVYFIKHYSQKSKKPSCNSNCDECAILKNSNLSTTKKAENDNLKQCHYELLNNN